MPNNQITIHDCATGKTIVRDMTDDEIERRDQIIADQQTAVVAQAAKALQRQAVLDKLGLTSDEAAALLG